MPPCHPGLSSLIVLVLAAASLPVAAQAPTRSNTRGLMLGGALQGSAIDSDDFDTESKSGGGFGLQLGWGFARRFTLLVGAAGARIEDDEDGDFVLVHFDLLARLNFRSGQAFVPFLEGGISARIAGQDDAIVFGDGGREQSVDLEISGGGLSFGGGFHYFVAPTVALGANLLVTAGEFSTVKFNNVSIDGFEIDATSTRVGLGITLYPMRGRP
jgi:hypothetical protein